MNNEDRDKMLTEIHGLVQGLSADSNNHGQRLSGHGQAIRENRDAISGISNGIIPKIAVYQERCKTRWNIAGWLVGATTSILVWVIASRFS